MYLIIKSIILSKLKDILTDDEDFLEVIEIIQHHIEDFGSIESV